MESDDEYPPEPPKIIQATPPTIPTTASKDNELRSKLLGLSLGEDKVEFLLKNGMKYIDKPELLDIKLGIGPVKAENIIEILKESRQNNVVCITVDIRILIDRFLKQNPQINNPGDIALVLEIEEDVVVAYLDSKALTKHQKKRIVELYNNGYSVCDIMNQLHISNTKILEYLAVTILVFDTKEGRKVLDIIHKLCDKVPVSKLREMITNNDLKLQDKLYILSKNNEAEYMQIFRYFKKFKESEGFFRIDLTMDDIILIKEGNLDIEQLSLKLNKVESVIREYLHSYEPHPIEREYYKQSQQERIENNILHFGRASKTFQSYRTIVSDSIDSIISRAERIREPDKVFEELLPLTFYYLKCSLPFEDITRIIANTCNILLTTHEIFHMIFQLSDPILRGFCIEHYSFSNPVPLYYPKFPLSIVKGQLKFEICSELWYSIQKYNCVISFGLGRAGWNRIGKSYLLDLIFETDFVRGNPRESAFHLNSIDIQMTKNLFAAVKDKNCKESTKWAYIDCNGNTDISVIQKICKHLEIAIIHISYYDHLHNRDKITAELHKFKYLKHMYICIRDYEGCTRITRKDGRTYIYIPNLANVNITSSYSTLKEIGFEILHLRYEAIGNEFIERLLTEFNTSNLKEIQSDKKCLQKIMSSIMGRTKSLEKLDFSFLNYYPYFIDYMNSFYMSANETNRDIIRAHNGRCLILKEELDKTSMGEVVQCFNDILERKNCALLLWKLSQELSILTNQIMDCRKGILSLPDESRVTHKNDKYNIEIIWREALLSSKYGKEAKNKVQEKFREKFATNFSNYVEIGEAFELIDGDNLRYFNQDIDGLLAKLYTKQNQGLDAINKGKKNKIPMRQAPIVVSIFGPQSSGKSTLLNYCFGCKFLTSAGRCTRGIYGSLCKLSKPVNCTNQFLILDTEGLDAIERENDTDSTLVSFDRTMVLFCLAVSQVVIINIKGELGNDMQNLFQICAYSLHKLKVSKVVAPKIFFVLNQQADPDPEKFLPAIKKLLEKLNKESDLMEIEGSRISDLIQVSEKNLYVLPSAFNAQQMNKPAANLFLSEVIKQSPAVPFVVQCAKLRLAIVNELIKMPLDERAPFKTMSEWMEMSGVIWDIIVKYIVKFRNVREMMCSNKLSKTVTDVLKKNITAKQKEFATIVEQLIIEIKEIKSIFNKNEVLGDKMLKFNETFEKYHDKCYSEFDRICQEDKIFKNMSYICENAKSNLTRLLYIEKKYYIDKLKSKIKVVWTDLHLSELMEKFQKAIDVNVDKYLEFDEKELRTAFEEIWLGSFGEEDAKEEEKERDEDFDNLYSIFKMESKTMENKQFIFEIFEKENFDMNKVISNLQIEILKNLESYVDSFSNEENYIFPWRENTIPIKDMTPYMGREHCEYLHKESLYKIERRGLIGLHPTPMINKWIPIECHGLIQYCSGYYNHADITWKMEDRKQILLLASSLKDPDNHKVSTWLKLVHKISSTVLDILKRDSQISKGTIKEIIHFLCITFSLVNHEINHIQAKLTNKAERTITTWVFAYAFKHIWEAKSHRREEYNATKHSKKVEYLEFFLQKVESRKLARGNWNRRKMREIDQTFSNKFALDFLNNVRRGIIHDEDPFIELLFLDQKMNLSHKSIFLLMNDIVSKEIQSNSKKEVLDQNNFAIQFICNRNEVVKRTFQGKWEEVVNNIYCKVLRDTRGKFLKQLQTVKDVITNLLRLLLVKGEEQLPFDSDSNFQRADKQDLLEHFREIPCRALVLYLEMYFDPTVTPENLKTFFDDTFDINGVQMVRMEDWVLCEKPEDPNLILDKEVYNKLHNTKIFNNEQIFNISVYLREFLSALNCYEFELEKSEFEDLECINKFKDDHEALVLSCPEQCPSCGKPCDRELHPHSGKCQIITGHLICSMGGKVWQNDEDKTAVLLSCDDYKDTTEVKILGKKMKWGEFKVETSNEWDWSLPPDEDYKFLQLENREKMKNIWNIFGRGILNNHAEKGKKIKYIPYTSYDDILKAMQSYEFNICFVIDGTGSMRSDIDKARISVGQLISHYRKHGDGAEFAIVIYRDHCDGEDIIQKFPDNGQFTNNHNSVEKFLEGVKVFGGGDGPEAVLDGLAIAVRNWNWSKKMGCRNVIVHIFDAPSHGNFPDYKSHSTGSNKGNCCCCSGLCKFDWQRDVWNIMRRQKIKYHGISTGRDFSNFQGTMKDKLGDLFGDVQTVDKEMVNDAVVQIFIDYRD